MISTQRLLMITILINIVIALGVNLYLDPNSVDTGTLMNNVNILEERESEFQSESATTATTKTVLDSVTENTMGNTAKWGLTIFKMMINGINPLSITTGMVYTEGEKWMVRTLTLIRALFMALMIIEIYLLIKNKKAS